LGLKDASGADISVYKAGSFSGKTIKVSVPKKASAPKVTVDYVKRQYTLPKGAQYRVFGGTDAAWKTPSDTTRTYVLTLDELAGLDATLSGTLEVRIAGTAAKAASKVAQFPLEKPEEISVCTSEEGVKQAQIPDSDILNNGIGADWNDSPVIVGYISNEKTKAFQGICFFNSSAEVYGVYVSKDGKVPDDSTTPTVKVAAKTANSTKDAETKLFTSKVSNGDKIYIRKQGDAGKKAWSSSYVCLGTVKYQKVR
jgi:hypothetical protein